MQNFPEMMQTGSEKAASLASVFENAENFEENQRRFSINPDEEILHIKAFLASIC